MYAPHLITVTHLPSAWNTLFTCFQMYLLQENFPYYFTHVSLWCLSYTNTTTFICSLLWQPCLPSSVCPGQFTWVISLHPQEPYEPGTAILAAILQQSHWGSERMSCLPKVTKLPKDSKLGLNSLLLSNPSAHIFRRWLGESFQHVQVQPNHIFFVPEKPVLIHLPLLLPLWLFQLF